jgi:hypothetical protein
MKRNANNRKHKNNNHTGKRIGRGKTGTSQLSVINNSPIQTRCLRYIGTVTSSTGVSSGSLLGLIVSVTNSSTTASRILDSLKIQRVGITCLPASDTNAGTFTFAWTGEEQRTPDIRKTMIYSQGVPAHWNFYPPDGSLAGYWVDSNDTSVIFTMDPDNATVKLVVDLEFSYILGSGSLGSTYTLSIASSFNGLGYRYLDWAAGGSSDLSPVDLDLVD